MGLTLFILQERNKKMYSDPKPLYALIQKARETMMGAKPLRQAIEDPNMNDHRIGQEIIHHQQPITSGKDVDNAVDHYRNELNNHEPGSANHNKITQEILPGLLKQRVMFDNNIHPAQMARPRF